MTLGPYLTFVVDLALCSVLLGNNVMASLVDLMYQESGISQFLFSNTEFQE